MLEELRVRNYALIDELEVRFEPHLNILTGETGAGKSIIVGALSALLGEKVDYETIRQGEKAATIEGQFAALDPQVMKLLAGAGIDLEGDTLVVRRRIERRARATNYANDQAVSAGTLKQLGDLLLDIHGQHEHQSLLRVELHRDILDRFGQLDDPRQGVTRAFIDWASHARTLASLEQEIAARKAQRDLLEFQAKEIEAAGIKPDELETSKQEKTLLESAERRAALCSEMVQTLQEKEGSVLELVNRVTKQLTDLLGLDPALAVDRTRVKNATEDLSELWRTLVAYQERIEFSPERLEQVNERLFFLERLSKKYGRDLARIVEYGARARSELASIEIDEERVGKMRTELARELEDLRTKARDLALARRKVKKDLETKAEVELALLGMPKAVFEVAIEPDLDAGGFGVWEGKPCRLAEHGLDRVEFLFSANPGEMARPLRKIASGGEMSRIMLALKGVLVRADRVPTMVFDEVDVGIGGRVAEAVGKKLRALADEHQVICITHLPQLAKYATRHFRVEKEVTKGRALTAIRALDRPARVREIARMLAGEKITETTLRHASEIVQEASEERKG